LNLACGPAEEARAEALKFVDGVGGEAVDFEGAIGARRQSRCTAIDKSSRSFGSGFG